MNHIEITVRALAGSRVDYVADELVRLATMLGVGVQCEFNGRQLSAYPGTEAREVLADFWRKR